MRLKKLTNKYTLLLLLLFYFCLNFFQLTLLPIFNDEAIYLDWGWRETHVPGHLYYSLYDGKQPLLMWIFGIFQSIFADPLFAGRAVSVLAGSLTLIGIYVLTKKFWDKQIACFASFIYLIIPLFVFYNRQALMESSLMTVNIWSLYFFLRLLESKKKKYAVFLGVVLGIGFFIKSTSLLFLITFLLISAVVFFKKVKEKKFLQYVLLTLATFLCTDLLLFINPQFWDTIASNNRYALSLHELFSFPITTWSHTIIDSSQILFFSFTPMVLFLILYGAIQTAKSKKFFELVVLFWTGISLFFYVMLSRTTTERYLLPFLLIFCIFAAIPCSQFVKKRLGQIFLFFSFSVLLTTTLFLIISPLQYSLFLGKISPFAHQEYITGQTSGYGITETVDFLRNQAKQKSIFVTIALNTGNPESAIEVYFEKDDHIHVIYLTDQLLGGTSTYDCLQTNRDTYFVSRNEELAGLDKFFTKIKTVTNPYGKNTIGIYLLKRPCRGKQLPLQIQSN